MSNNDLVHFDKLNADIQLFVAPLMNMVIADQDSSLKVLGAAKELKGYLKKVEDKRDDLVRPHNLHVKSINDYAKKIKSPLEAAEAHLKTQLKTWELWLEKERMAALKKAEEERLAKEAALRKEIEDKKALEAEDIEALFKPEDDKKREEIVTKVEQERSAAIIQQNHRELMKTIESQKVSGASKVWTFKVVNQAEIPIEFLSVNESAIRKAIGSGSRMIPGVEIFQETRISIR